VVRVTKRVTDAPPLGDPAGTSVAQLGEQTLDQIGRRLTQPLAEQLGVRVNPRYGTWTRCSCPCCRRGRSPAWCCGRPELSGPQSMARTIVVLSTRLAAVLPAAALPALRAAEQVLADGSVPAELAASAGAERVEAPSGWPAESCVLLTTDAAHPCWPAPTRSSRCPNRPVRRCWTRSR